MPISIRSFSEELHSPHIPVKAVALKEWAACIDALGDGTQHILVRKGGILEETREFRIEETSFYLYPTYEHQNKELLKPGERERLARVGDGIELPPQQVTITHAAHVVDDITFKHEEPLGKLDPYHILTHQYATERLQWRSNEPLHILVVRTYRLSEPKTITVRDEYLGCRSWITLAEAIADTDLIPVLDAEAFRRVRDEIHELLGVQAK